MKSNKIPFVDYDITFCDNEECQKAKQCHRWRMYQIYKADKRENKRIYISMYRGKSNNCNLFTQWEQISMHE